MYHLNLKNVDKDLKNQTIMENIMQGNSPAHTSDGNKNSNENSAQKKRTRRSKKAKKEIKNSNKYATENTTISTSNYSDLNENIKFLKGEKMKSSHFVNGVMENFNSQPCTSRTMNYMMVPNINAYSNQPGIPSTSKINISNKSRVSNATTEKYSPVKHKYTSPKEKYQRLAESGICNFNAFNAKKRAIWKPPVTNEIVKEMIFVNSLLLESKVTENDFHFDICSVQNPTQGFFVRKRSTGKYVNLMSFGSKFPVSFISNFTIRNSDTSLKILNEKMETINLNVSPISSSEKHDLLLEEKRNQIEKVIEKMETPMVTRHTNKSNSKLDGSVVRESQTMKQKSKRVKTKGKTPKKKVGLGSYSEYFTEREVEQGLSDGSLIKGLIRINQRNSRDAYVTNIIKGDTDYLIKSVVDQNRALDGDEVVLKIKPETEWDEGRKTAVVVHISKMIHSRTSVGKIVPLRKNEIFAEFLPRDNRFPIVYIPSISWPQGFQTDPGKFSKNLFVVKITEWTSPECARGLIIENIGTSGNLKVENLAILKSCGLDYEPFGNEVLKYLPKMDELQNNWLEGREDLRKECVFSIDPLTARDLDDAVSCKTLADGNLEIGVHIADVSHFLTEGTELDKQVGWKATTIYMVEHVYHMLPIELCMSCSLLPARDKLSFSVFWTMTPDGDVLSTRFARTIMNSCVQLAYEHAQAIIDDPENFDSSAFPKIYNGYTVDDIKEVVLQLYLISMNLRRRRFQNGALRIDQIKLSFDLDPDTGMPVAYHKQEQREANRLIEEFMLLANISVAEKIIDSFPEIAFLRLHEPPKEGMMNELKVGLESVGIHVDISTAKSVHSSLLKYSSDDAPGKVRTVVLNHLFAKPMTRARYFCPALEKAGVSYGHYALNIPLYTHFTSPIRRYADIMVHRLLAASLGIAQKPDWQPEFVSEVAQRCNILKYNAKKAQEESTKLYLSLYIANNGPFVRDAGIIDVKERTFDALVLDTGEIVRIYVNDIEGCKSEVEEIPCLNLDSVDKVDKYQKKYWRLKLIYPPTKNFKATELIIELFSMVKVELKKCPKKQKLQAKLLRPTS